MSNSERRSKDRSAGILYRVSPENRQELRRRAAEAGFPSVQDWLDALLLGHISPKADQEALPMTG